MEQVATAHIASLLLAAPTWAKLGLAVRDERMRERAAGVLASIVVEHLAAPEPDRELEPDARQLALPM